MLRSFGLLCAEAYTRSAAWTCPLRIRRMSSRARPAKRIRVEPRPPQGRGRHHLKCHLLRPTVPSYDRKGGISPWPWSPPPGRSSSFELCPPPLRSRSNTLGKTASSASSLGHVYCLTSRLSARYYRKDPLVLLAANMSAGGSWLYRGLASLCDSLLSSSIKANFMLLSHAACVVDGSILSSWFWSFAAGVLSSRPPSSRRPC